jgi:peptidoglycan/LPS O-acetylase OafA/YrhL
LHVDRLRGLAAFGVVLSHASGYGFLNAFVYVLPYDVLVTIAMNAYHAVALFFVISGFLITTKLLQTERSAGSISLSIFYRDRVARIAPCLLLMLAVAIGLSAAGVPAFSAEWSNVRSALIAVFTFRYNLEVGAYPMPRLWDVLWSLSIEEVFYLFSPALMLFLPRQVLIVLLSALVVIGPIHRAVTGSFYAYFSNFDLLASGVLTAIACDWSRKLAIGSNLLRGCRWLGTATICTVAWRTTDAHAAIVWGPEVIGLGAAIYLFGTSGAPKPRWSFLVMRPLALSGRLSYEIYLFHMFLLVAVGHTGNLAIRTADNAVLFDTMIAAGYLVGLIAFAALVSHFYSEPANRFLRNGSILWRRPQASFEPGNSYPAATGRAGI